MPEWKPEILRRLAPLNLAPTREAEIADELSQHLEDRYQELLAGGQSEDAAFRVALDELKGEDLLARSLRPIERDLYREPVALGKGGCNFLSSILQDLRFGLRMLRKSPGFTAVAILTLALGIGANTAIFSALDCIVLKALPYPDSSQLLDLQATDIGGCPIPDCSRIRAESRTLSDIAIYVGGETASLVGTGEPEELSTPLMSADVFPLLRVPPLLGRWFLSSETQRGNDRVAILSYPLWRDSFGSDRHIVGRSIMLNRGSGPAPYKVVGVMPPKFEFPENSPSSDKRLWLPVAPTQSEMTVRWGGISAIARSVPGVSLQEVQTELGVISSHLDKSDSKVYKQMRYWAKPVKEEVVQWAQVLLLILFAIAGFVLLIACTNLANLFLSRGWARRPEMAVRTTLGATRWRVVRQLLVECLLLSIGGGIAGFLLAFSSVGTLRHLLPADTPRLDQLRIDPAALWFTLGISLLAALFFGLAPALIVSRQDPNEIMKEGGSRSSGALSSRAGRRLRDGLVVAEVALAFLLVLSAGLALRGLSMLSASHFGFRTDHLLTFDVPRPRVSTGSGFDAPEFSRTLLLKLRALPGVQSVAGKNLGLMLFEPLHVQAMPDENLASLPRTWAFHLTPGYFATMGIPFKSGHDFAADDKMGSQFVAIVNESLARLYFQDATPIGKQITVHGMDFNNPKSDQTIRIVGEVADTRLPMFPMSPPVPTLYLDYYQYPAYGIAQPVLRTASDPILLVPAIRGLVASTLSDRPIEDLETVDQQIAQITTYPRSRTILLGSFGALGLLLAAIGIYGVISYSVVLRTHEIGVRMAFGAQPENVMRLIVAQGARPVLVGVLLGVAGAVALARFLRTLVFVAGLSVTDPLTFTLVAVTLVLVALAACYIPARRAMRVDPLTALRHE